MKSPIVCMLATALLAFAGAAGAEESDSRSGEPAHEQRMHEPEPGTMPEEGQHGERENPAVEAPPPQASGPDSDEYVVEEGDTLSSIAERTLGSQEEWERIAEVNGIEDPKSLKAGQRLQIPARGAERKTEGDS